MKGHLLIGLLIFLVTAYSGIAQENRGHLMIIGGGKRPDYMMKKIIELAGGKDAKIVIIPNASSEPIETAEYQKGEFERLGAENVSFIYADREKADEDSVVGKLDSAKGIFFSGGDQRRLPRDLLSTRLLERIKEIYNNGGVISGTSAGAAVMSKIMITGDEINHPDAKTAFGTIEKDNIKTSEGFGFVNDAIIDQHFIYRKRHNRLISLVLENPELLGIGIDESSSILVYPDHIFEVIGKYQVIVYDAHSSSDIRATENNLLSASDIKMHILANGDKFDIKNKKVLE